MFYTYLTQNEGNYNVGVCAELLYKKLPEGLCYFEVFAKRSEATSRKKSLEKLSSAKLFSIINSKKAVGFTCHKEGEKTVIGLKNGVYNLTGAIVVKGQDIVFRGQKNTVIQGCSKIDGWVDEGSGVFSAATEYDRYAEPHSSQAHQ